MFWEEAQRSDDALLPQDPATARRGRTHDGSRLASSVWAWRMLLHAFAAGTPHMAHALDRCAGEQTTNSVTNRENPHREAEIPPWIGGSARQLRNCRRAGDGPVPLVLGRLLPAQRNRPWLICSGLSQVSALPRRRWSLASPPPWLDAGGGARHALRLPRAAPHWITTSR